MQIFLTSSDLSQCATDLDDRRLNKIIIEAAQIASTGLWKNNCGLAEMMYSQGLIYLPTHESHPLCVWVSECYTNNQQVIRYGLALCHEYEYRFDKRHATYSKLINLVKVESFKYNHMDNWSEQPNCTTNHKHINDVYEAYRRELCLKWNHKDKKYPVWTKRNEPEWRYYYEK